MSIFEIGMLVGFGFAWPSNIYKSLKSRTAAGRSGIFLWAILFGYICGIVGELLSPGYKWYVLFFYVLNMTMVGVDLLLYARNAKLDRQK